MLIADLFMYEREVEFIIIISNYLYHKDEGG